MPVGFGALIPTADAYYCDSVNGNDSNAGTYNAPFATIAHMASVDAGANKNRWRLVTGSAWREQLTVPRAGMTIDAYGPGAAPLLDCSDIIASGAWSKTAGRTNVYQATLTVPVNTPSDPDWYTSVWENDTRYTIAHSIAAVDSAASSYYPVAVNSTTITLYVHTSSGASPATFTKMEYAARLAGIMAQGVDRVTLAGIRTRRNIDANGSIILGRDCQVYNSTAEEGNKHNIFFDAGAVLHGVECKGAYYENLGTTMFIGYGAADAARGFDFINCSAVTMGLADSTPPGFFIHSSVLGQTFAFVNFQGCSGDIAFSACQQVIINNCTASNGFHAYDATSLAISNSAASFNSSDQYGISAPNTACAVSLANVTLTGPVRSGLGGTCINLAVAGSSLIVSGGTFQTAAQFVTSVGAASITVSGATVDVFHYGYYDQTATPTFAVDGNTYVSPNSGEFAKLSGVDKTYAQWKATGQDAHSTP